MLNRRDFLNLTTLAAIGAGGSLVGAANAWGARWPPYQNSLAIDGEGGAALFFLKSDDPSIPKELDALRVSGLTGMLLSVGPRGAYWLSDSAFANTKKFIADCKAKIAAHPDVLLLVRGAQDLQRARREKRIGVVLRFQGTEPLGEDTDRIPLFRKLGVLVIQLTHNRRNLVGDGATEPGDAGLSNYGHQVIERLNAEKVVVDLAHGSRRTIKEGIAASKVPVVISHTGCRALADLPRNVDDAQLREMADRGGVAGIIFWPYLRTDTQPMAIDVIRHIEHAIKICGENHVGIGTDGPVLPIERTPKFETENRKMIQNMVETGILTPGRPPDLYTFIPDLNVANRFEVLASMLSARGHSDVRIAKVLGGNFARVLGQVWA